MKSKRALIILLAAAMVLAASSFALIYGATATPGSSGDPVVSKSYVDEQIAALKSELGSGSSAAQTYSVVQVAAGKSVIAGASCEIILRSGTASAIASSSGGVADLTGGTDLKTGFDVPKNHLLLIPADDGRGIKCSTMSYVMIKGDYSIK